MTTAKVSAPECGLRRVTVHTGTGNLDVVLPAEVPLAALMPAIVDILSSQPNADPLSQTTPHDLQLSRPGQPALNALTTLAQNGIHDGATLVLTRAGTDLPAPRFDDPAEAISAVRANTVRPWNRRAAQLTAVVTAGWLTGMIGLTLIYHAFHSSEKSFPASTFGILTVSAVLSSTVLAHRASQDPLAGLPLSLFTTALSALAGFVVVPGSPGAPHLLLATAAGAATAITAMRVTGCSTVPLTAVWVFGATIGVAALAGVLSGAPRQAIGSLSAVLCLGLVEISPWMSIRLAGLAPRLPSETADSHLAVDPDLLVRKAGRASDGIVALVLAFSSSAAVNAISTAIPSGGSKVELSGIGFAGLVGFALLLRARSTTDLQQRAILLGSGVITWSGTFVVVVANWPQYTPWLVTAATLLTAGVLYWGYAEPRMPFSPLANRVVQLSEYLALAASVPLAGWLCGLYRIVPELRVLLT
ncbi:MAG: type VII secretion integral membrane protein EccD [Mycobacteriaceae bacterium]|nr:type VII secretion integral membrane protein EccD [Mycobacteriaceae bacterium]